MITVHQQLLGTAQYIEKNIRRRFDVNINDRLCIANRWLNDLLNDRRFYLSFPLWRICLHLLFNIFRLALLSSFGLFASWSRTWTWTLTIWNLGKIIQTTLPLKHGLYKPFQSGKLATYLIGCPLAPLADGEILGPRPLQVRRGREVSS